MSTSGGVQYIGGCRDACGDIMRTSGDVQYIGGHHNACREQVGKAFQFLLKTPMY